MTTGGFCNTLSRTWTFPAPQRLPCSRQQHDPIGRESSRETPRPLTAVAAAWFCLPLGRLARGGSGPQRAALFLAGMALRANNGGMLGQQWQILAKEWNPIRHPATVSFPLSPMWVHKARTTPGRPQEPSTRRVIRPSIWASGHPSIFRGRGDPIRTKPRLCSLCFRATQPTPPELENCRISV
jgi:hypothetical protein